MLEDRYRYSEINESSIVIVEAEYFNEVRGIFDNISGLLFDIVTLNYVELYKFCTSFTWTVIKNSPTTPTGGAILILVGLSAVIIIGGSFLTPPDFSSNVTVYSYPQFL